MRLDREDTALLNRNGFLFKDALTTCSVLSPWKGPDDAISEADRDQALTNIRPTGPLILGLLATENNKQ